KKLKKVSASKRERPVEGHWPQNRMLFFVHAPWKKNRSTRPGRSNKMSGMEANQ
ncbi:hypothetical protein NDU88_004481, partial [Pleurodeles waltl]